MTYSVEVTREDGVWIADVVNLDGAHTHAGNLTVLRRKVQEVIGLVLDAPEHEMFDVEYTYSGVEAAFAAAIALGERRHAADLEAAQIAADTAATVAKLVDQGWSVRDVGGALGLSPGRVTQLLGARKAHSTA